MDRRRVLPAIAAAIWGLALALAAPSAAGGIDVTFFVTSDSHYEAVERLDRNGRDLDTIRQMNVLAGQPWPERLGRGAIGKPQGVLVLGDLVDDGDRKGETAGQWKHFVKQFGLDGKDGMLRYPAMEGWGNHDGPPAGRDKNGFSVQAEIQRRNQARRRLGPVQNVSQNGLHYSWDWGGVHFVQLNLYPSDKPHPRTKYNPVWHDPQQALSFLVADLKKEVGPGGRPVVLASHYGFDCDWWQPEEMQSVYDALRDYRVVLYLHGHTGTKVYTWKPKGREKALDVINTGQTEVGFFVVQITGDRVRAAYRVKDVRGADWDGTWTWQHFLDRRLQEPLQ